MKLVQQNSPSDVEATTAAAIAALPDLEKAVGIASKLKAVGPATASGQPKSLALRKPTMCDNICF